MKRDAFRGQVVIVTVWLKVLAPGLVDWLAIKLFIEPMIRRAKAAEIDVKPQI